MYPAEEIALLYAERWKIEVKFRDIKTTMKLEMIWVKKPEMARKSLRMAFIAYNLVKALQMDAIAGEPYVMDEIGFKGTLDVVTEFRGQFRKLVGQAATSCGTARGASVAIGNSVDEMMFGKS